MNGLPVILLTTTGRKTAKPHTVPVVHLRDGADYVIAPGVVERPAWLLNLHTNHFATMQAGSNVIPVEAREADEEERRRLWLAAPGYWHDYQKAAENELPFIVLKRRES